MAGIEQLPDRLQRWYARGRLHAVDGCRLFAIEAGAGEPVLLLHGFPTASWTWHQMIDVLAQDYRVLAPDLLGSGFSDKPRSGPYGIPALRSLVARLCKQLELPALHVLAHAYGSTVAQDLLAHSLVGALPQVSSLCLISSGVFAAASHRTFFQRLLLTRSGAVLGSLFPAPASIFRRQFARTFGAATQPSPEELAEYWALLRWNQGQRRVPAIIRYLVEREAHEARWVQALQQAPIAVGLMGSSGDPVTAEVLAQWRTQLPQRWLHELPPNLGHYPPLEDPSAVLEAYRAFRRWAVSPVS